MAPALLNLKTLFYIKYTSISNSYTPTFEIDFNRTSISLNSFILRESGKNYEHVFHNNYDIQNFKYNVQYFLRDKPLNKVRLLLSQVSQWAKIDYLPFMTYLKKIMVSK